MSCDCWCSVALPQVAVGWSAVCNCGGGGFWSYKCMNRDLGNVSLKENNRLRNNCQII